MRLLTLSLPLLLLAALLPFMEGKQLPVVAAGVAPEQSGGHAMAPPGVVWISHDWVEVEPRKLPPARSNRRETFGIEAARIYADCSNPNCRACLIDLVYGQEF